eukprot:4408927-Amphidinium_carterae.1
MTHPPPWISPLLAVISFQRRRIPPPPLAHWRVPRDSSAVVTPGRQKLQRYSGSFISLLHVPRDSAPVVTPG